MLLLKSRRRRSRWSRQSSRSPWLTALLLIASIPVGVELLARLVIMVTGFNDVSQENAALQRAHGYQLQFVTADNQPYDSQNGDGELLAARNPLLGYHLIPGQSNPFWTLNPQGFREDEPVTPEKVDGEIRIFILGGSTAFGQLSTSNDNTVAHQMEQLLNQRVEQQRTSPEAFQPPVLPYRADQVQDALALPPRMKDGQYRVINAAVPGYASGNDLAQLMTQVVRYQPDIIVLLNGYADLLLPSSEMGSDIPGLDALILNTSPGIVRQLSDRLQAGISHLAVVRIYRHYQSRNQPDQPIFDQPLNIPSTDLKTSFSDYVGSDANELQERTLRYQHHLDQMVQWASGTQKRLIIGLQPEITGRDAEVLTAPEASIVASLGENYQQWMQAGYTQLNERASQSAQQSANATVVNLYEMYDEFPEQAFQSPDSLTDAATVALAETLYEAIATQLTLTSEPFTGRGPR